MILKVPSNLHHSEDWPGVKDVTRCTQSGPNSQSEHPAPADEPSC